MGKPGKEVFEVFRKKSEESNRRNKMNQFLVPYFMSSHPGCTLEDAIMLAEYMKKSRLHPEQVQDFYPTPGTLSTCMFYTGIDPRSGKKVYVAKTPEEKAMQRALMQYNRPENRELVTKALRRAGRIDLIGKGEHCLIPFASSEKTKVSTKPGSGKRNGEKKHEAAHNADKRRGKNRKL
jgi:radical SAM superfamily enzyme YgiQ (UPF0313 family)